MPDDILTEFFKYLPEKDREEFKFFPQQYEIELNKTKDDLINSLYKLKKELHPQFLFTVGHSGTLNDIDWLIKNKKYFDGDYKEKSRRERNDHVLFLSRLGQLSNNLSGMLFGQFADEPYESELVYTIAADTFKKMGLHSYTRIDKDQERRKLYVDLSSIDLGYHAYRFVPWTSEIDKSVGKPLREYYLENELNVEMGLKPVVFRFISSGVTTPVHEIIHHISSLYNKDAYNIAVTKTFNESFKDVSDLLSLAHDRGSLFGGIDKKIRKKIKEKELDIRGKDLTDPFVFWEIVKRHGPDLAGATEILLDKLYESSSSYLSGSIPFRLMEEGVASYLAINNASINRAPSEFKGLDNSIKNMVSIGAKLEKFRYLQRRIDFYTNDKKLADYYIPELQIYPVSYLYIAYQADRQKPVNTRWYFDLIKKNFLKRNIKIPSHPRVIEKKRKEDLNPRLAQQQKIETMMQQMNQNIVSYRQRLDEIDNLLNEYRNQLNRLESSHSDPSFSDIPYRPHRRPLGSRRPSLSNEIDMLFNNRRVSSTISRQVRNNDTVRTIMYAVAGGIIILTLNQAIRHYLAR